MWSVLLRSLPFLGSFVTKYFNVVIYIIVFGFGAYASHLYYDSKINDMIASYNEQVLKLSEDSVVRLQERERTVAKIMDERNEAQIKINDMSSELAALNGRVQQLSSQRVQGDSNTTNSTSANSQVNNKVTSTRNSELIKRGEDLVRRYSDLVERLTKLGLLESNDKDTLVRYISEDTDKK